MHRTLRFEHTVLLCFLKISCTYFLTSAMEHSPSRESLLGSPRIYGTRIFITKSQWCASWSYSLPDESSSCPVLLSPILISSYKRQVLPSGLVLWSFATRSCMHVSSPSSTIPDTLLIPSFLIWWCEYFAGSTNHEALHCVVSFGLLLFPPSWAHIFLSTLFVNTLRP